MGIHETGAKPPKSRCVIVYVSSEFPSQGTEVAVEICELGKNEIGQLDFVHRRHVIGFDVDEKSITHFRLSVKVENERITELRFNDRILPEAEDALRDVKIATNATCGVVASTNVVFHSLICKDKRL